MSATLFKKIRKGYPFSKGGFYLLLICPLKKPKLFICKLKGLILKKNDRKFTMEIQRNPEMFKYKHKIASMS